MATIGNDQDLRDMLGRLSVERQRHIGGMFIESALDLWAEGAFSEVKNLLEELKDDDILSKRLYERASELEKNPPGGDWSAICELDKKCPLPTIMLRSRN